MIAQPDPLQCPRCQSTELNRQISRFARVRGEDESLTTPWPTRWRAWTRTIPKAMRRLMRTMGDEMGDDMEADFEHMMEDKASFAADGMGDTED